MNPELQPMISFLVYRIDNGTTTPQDTLLMTQYASEIQEFRSQRDAQNKMRMDSLRFRVDLMNINKNSQD
jgi:hypothetical protein